MLNSNVELVLFQTLIQRITFTNCIPIKTLCEFSYRREINDPLDDPPPKNDKTQDPFMLPEIYNPYNKRYNRLLKQLSIENFRKNAKYVDKENAKIYDEFMFKSQIKLYNLFADIVGYKLIEKVLPIPLITNAAFLDDAKPDYDTIAKYYPYFLPKHMPSDDTKEKRKYFDGVNFFEFVLLLNLDLGVHHRIYKTLCNSLNDKENEKRAQKMVTAIIENMKTREMFEVYAHTFFDVLEKIVFEKHNKKAEEYIQFVWLPERYRHRKNIFNAFERHKKDKIKISTNKYEFNQLGNIIKRGNAYEQMVAKRKMLDYYGIQEIGENIIPLAWKILICDKKDLEPFENTSNYFLSEEYAQIIKNYIDNTIIEVENFLKYMYIEKESPLRQEE